MTEEWPTVLEVPCLKWEALGSKRGGGEAGWDHILSTNIDHPPYAQHRTLSSEQNTLKLLFSQSYFPVGGYVCPQTCNFRAGKKQNKAR